MGPLFPVWFAAAHAGPQFVSEIPGPSATGSADFAYKLDVVEVYRTSRLVTAAPWVRFDGETHVGDDLLYVAVYEEGDPNEWTKVWDSGLVGPAGDVGDFFPVDPGILLEGGRRYAIGVVFDEGNFNYQYESGSGITPFPWGRHVGAVYVSEDGIGSIPTVITGNPVADIGYWQELTIEVVDLDGDGVTEDTDCDDEDPANYPGSPEYCDGVDNDCSGVADDGVDYLDWFPDLDGDGFGDDAASISVCLPGAPPDHIAVGGDCDDADTTVNPDIPEFCDGRDEDCSGVADDDPVTRTGWEDLDGDTFGGAAVTWCTADSPLGLVPNPYDCDDADADVSPTGVETCDGVDQDCDGFVDDGLATRVWWLDADGDGFGDPATALTWCETPPEGYIAEALDCDDTDPRRAPGNAEICDGVDDDCDGVAGGEGDFDGDGWIDCLDCAAADGSTYPGAPEVCDGLDHDCDGIVKTRIECDPAPDEDVGVLACSGCATSTGSAMPGFVAFALIAGAARRRKW